MKRSRIKTKIRKCKICGEDMWEVGKKGSHIACHIKKHGQPEKPKATKPRASSSKKSRTSALIKELDAICSVIVRLRDTDEDGYGTCISTGQSIFYYLENDKVVSNCDCGHLFHRWKGSLRHDLDNMHAQLRTDNRDQNKSDDKMHENVQNKIGIPAYNNLKLKSTGIVKFNSFDMAHTKVRYMEMLKVLLDTKNWSHKTLNPRRLWAGS